MNIPYIPGKGKYTFFLNGTTKEVKDSNPLYVDIIDAINKGDETRINELLTAATSSVGPVSNLKSIIEETIDNLTLKIDEVMGTCSVIYNNQVTLPQCLADLLVRLWRDGCKSFSHYSKFIENLLGNPSQSSRESLFDFLAIQQLPITENGTFIAYKGVLSNMYSKTGNKSTRVVSGTVDSCGRILNQPGSLIRVLVEDVDPNRSVGCSTGLHVGSYKYASDFGEVTVAVEVNPMHVISVPNDCGFQKCRVSEYTVLHVIEKEFEASEVQVSEDKKNTTEISRKYRVKSNTPIEKVDKTVGRSDAEDRARVVDHLRNASTHGVDHLSTVRRINKALFKGLTTEETAKRMAQIGFSVMAHGDPHTGNWFVADRLIQEFV